MCMSQEEARGSTEKQDTLVKDIVRVKSEKTIGKDNCICGLLGRLKVDVVNVTGRTLRTFENERKNSGRLAP